MYFQSLPEFEAILRGHELAFEQISGLSQHDLFHKRFSDWIYNRHELSCASGWAFAIVQYCAEKKLDPFTVFQHYVGEFLDEWGC